VIVTTDSRSLDDLCLAIGKRRVPTQGIQRPAPGLLFNNFNNDTNISLGSSSCVKWNAQREAGDRVRDEGKTPIPAPKPLRAGPQSPY
jgi:hypothetical protein